ncbi:MAG TPA: 50S ribosomal protein L9 [Planctomycetes bacterium]|nr:50S ribosomal protein L9 [Planctomycetota bacterium]
MKQVTVLLREMVQDLGGVGDVVRVAPGYARNYLLPYKLAVEATPENVKMLERRRARLEEELQQREAETSAKIESLGRLKLSTAEKADETGTLYGSVGAARIAELLTAAGHATEEKDVRLDEPIKSVGTHEVPIHVFGEHYAAIQVVVESAE